MKGKVYELNGNTSFRIYIYMFLSFCFCKKKISQRTPSLDLCHKIHICTSMNESRRGGIGKWVRPIGVGEGWKRITIRWKNVRKVEKKKIKKEEEDEGDKTKENKDKIKTNAKSSAVVDVLKEKIKDASRFIFSNERSRFLNASSKI